MSTNEIQDELERTRSEMDSTLNELEHRLAPGPIMENIIESVRSGTLADSSKYVTERVKANPFAAALVGFGVGWLMLSSTERSGTHQTRLGAEVESRKHRLRRGGAGTEAGGASSGTEGRLGRYSEMARQRSAQAQDAVGSMVERHPFATGLMAVAAGAAIAAVLPITRREDEWMGGAREEVGERARELGREEMDRARRVAESAGEAAQEQAHREGLDKEGAREQWQNAKEKAEHVVEAAKDAAREEAKR